MAEILPFRALRYNADLTSEIDNLTSPLFDVVSDEQLEELYSNPLNSIHLSVPRGPEPVANAKITLSEWLRNGVLSQDMIPGIYIYYQYFRLPGMNKELCRKGFVCLTRIYDWDNDDTILRHENTMPWSVNDRMSLLEGTQLQSSPTFGLYDDDSFELEDYMDAAMAFPIYESEDYQGVRDMMAVIHDREVINRFIKRLRDKQIILADGHHRYEGALANMRAQTAANPQHTGSEGYNFHMMYFTNSLSGDFRILPTHRVINGLPAIDEEQILRESEKYFTIKKIPNPSELNEIIAGKLHAFGLLIGNKAFKLRLLPDLAQKNPWPFPSMIKGLDITVLHYFFIEMVLGIKGHDQRESSNISFDRSFADCLVKAGNRSIQMALIVNEIEMQTVLNVCHSGFTMPQKSTYFYPKAICGFLFYSLQRDETDDRFSTCFG